MPDILHRVGIDASLAKVFNAITTIDGLSHWWVEGTRGEPDQGGGIILFGFADMKVMDLQADLVRWKCVRGPEEWVGTEIIFRLKRKDDQTFVLFKHADWEATVEFMHHCSTKWATFLLSLKDWLEKGEGHPAPRDIKIHIGD